jgi:hypothetical protein
MIYPFSYHSLETSIFDALAFRIHECAPAVGKVIAGIVKNTICWPNGQLMVFFYGCGISVE